MIPCPCQVLECIGQGRCPGSRGQCRHAAFQPSHSLLKYIQSRICKTAVYIPRITEIEPRRRMVTVVKYIR